MKTMRWIGKRLLIVAAFGVGLWVILFVQETVFPSNETQAVRADQEYQRMLDEQAEEDHRILDNFVEENSDG